MLHGEFHKYFGKESLDQSFDALTHCESILNVIFTMGYKIISSILDIEYSSIMSIQYQESIE